MKELEKILEELKKAFEQNIVKELNGDGTVDKYSLNPWHTWNDIEEAIRKHSVWIPVEERLPEEGQEVWVSLKTDCVRRGMYTKRLGDRRLEGFICSDGFVWMNTANAWKPYVVPEPYRSERSNDAKE